MSHTLLEPFQLGDLALRNRVVMAPLTRGRAENPGLVPTALMAEYYRQRAGTGLIVTEGTWPSREAIGFVNVPGLYSAEQVEGWRAVTDAVHGAGGVMFSQLGHLGALSHPDHLDGRLPVAPSAINPEEMSFTPTGFKETVVPREMTVADIRRTVEDYRVAALHAKEAGFDGVEIHGAHLYLIPAFLSSVLNRRTDAYGGSSENRCRFVLEILDAAISVWGAKRVGLKLSPAASSGRLVPNDETEPTYRHLLGALGHYDLAYVHALGAQGSPETVPAHFQDIARYFRPLYAGTLIVGGGYTKQSGEDVLRRGDADLVAYGAPFIANPDLVERFRSGIGLAEADPSTFYTGGAKGYAD